MTRLGTRPQEAPLRNTSGTLVRVVGLAVVIVALFVGTSLLTIPLVVPKLTVANPGQYQVNVEAGGTARDEWSDLGTMERESTRTVEEVADAGPTWVFRFSYAGVPGGELVVTRDELARDGWRITVPPEVTERLSATGLRPSSR